MSDCRVSSKFTIISVLIYLLVALLLLKVTPIVHSEANILFDSSNTVTSTISRLIYSVNSSIVFIRFLFFLISLLSLYLFSKMAEDYSIYKDYKHLSILIYLLIPGVFLSFVIVNYATIPIFLTLLFIYFYKKTKYYLWLIPFVLLFFTNTAVFAFYIATALYAYSKKEWLLLVVSFALFLVASVYSSYPIDGIPRGHLVELFGIYGAVLSPLLFIFIVYSLYRVGVKGKKTLLWYISTTLFVVSLLLSIRQKIKVTDFTPYIVIAVPMVVLVYKNSISIRLKEFRKIYIKICYLIVTMLLLETSLIALNYPIYHLFNKTLWLIDKNIYITPVKIKKLEKKGIKCLDTIRNRDINLYKYYGIEKCR